MTVETVYGDGEAIAEAEDETYSDGEEEGRYTRDRIMMPSPRVSLDRIILPSPRVSVEERELPILAKQDISFEERLMAANPEATAAVELSPCDTCGRKFNPTSLEKHVKICQKSKSTPRKIFDAVNKLWKTDVEAEAEKSRVARTPKVERKKKPAKAEDNYKTCDFCRRKFCDNAFERHVEFCREKTNRLQTSPPRDDVALAKLQARTKYNPQEVAKSSRRQSVSPSRKMSTASLYSEVSLPPWNLGSGRNTPSSYTSLTRAEGNLRSSRRSTTGPGTKSLGRAGGAAYLRQGDAGDQGRDWCPEKDAKATTLSRDASGRGSIRKPALTKAALMRLAAGEKKAEEEEKKRQKSEFGCDMRGRAVTPSQGLMTRSAYSAGTTETWGAGDRRKSKTPQLSRRSSSRGYGRESTSPYSWQGFHPVMKPSPYHPLTSDRAEPDGIENEDDYQHKHSRTHKDSLEGAYDHSKEYDPFETAERQMQELLFGPSSSTTTTTTTSSRAVQKPQPVRPSSTSAFSAYVPARPTQSYGSSSPDSPTRSFSYSKPSYSSYSSAPTKSPRDYQSPNRQSPPKLSSSYTRPTALSLNSMTNSDFSPHKEARQEGTGLARQGSLRASASARGNWKDLFPSLSRQPSTTTAAAAGPSDSSSSSSSAAQNQMSALARFCHGCGNPFPMPHVRFCCECGMRRLYT